MYQAFSSKQMQVMTWWKHSVASRYDAIIADGSIRAGKTLCMSTSFLLWAMTTFDNMNFAICGKTVTSCQRNVITPLLNEMQGMMAFKSVTSRNYIECRYNGKCNRFYVFGGKDEGSAALIQGITLAGILLDEVALMPRSFVEQGLGRCSVEGSKFWLNCNPEHPLHWFYQEWIQKAVKKKALYVHFTMKDNPTLSEDMQRRYEGLFDGVFYDRYIRGLWVVSTGVIYPMFNKEFHIVPVEPRPYQEYQISMDYGTVNPCSMGLWGLANGVWYRIKEYYHSGRDTGKTLTCEEYYEALEELAGGLNIRRIIADPSADSFIALVRRRGKFSIIGANNDVISGISNVASVLKQGKIKFNACCKDTFKEFALYRWNDKGGDDMPIKENDHAMDEIRYFVRTNKLSIGKFKGLAD